jgi:hypothetical protein
MAQEREKRELGTGALVNAAEQAIEHLTVFVR